MSEVRRSESERTRRRDRIGKVRTGGGGGGGEGGDRVRKKWRGAIEV